MIGIYAEILQHKKIFGFSAFLKNLLRFMDSDVLLLFLKNLETPRIYSNYKIYGDDFPLLINRFVAHNQISKEKFEILYWPYQRIYFLKKPKSKFVFTLHDLIPLLFPQWHSKFNIYFDFRIMLKKAIKYAEKIICISKTTENDLFKFYGKETKNKTTVIYNGVDHGVFYPRSKKEIKKVKEKFGIKKEYILYTGGFHPRKNVSALIKAFEIARNKFDIQLVMTGEGKGVFSEIDALIENSKFKNDIKVTGFITYDYLPALYSGGLLYVSPSFYEGFGLGVLESLACGTPAIVSDIPVMRELFPELPKFNPTKKEELANLLMELIENEQRLKYLSRVGAKTAKKYSWKKTAKKYLEVFQEIAKR